MVQEKTTNLFDVVLVIGRQYPPRLHRGHRFVDLAILARAHIAGVGVIPSGRDAETMEEVERQQGIAARARARHLGGPPLESCTHNVAPAPAAPAKAAVSAKPAILISRVSTPKVIARCSSEPMPRSARPKRVRRSTIDVATASTAMSSIVR